MTEKLKANETTSKKTIVKNNAPKDFQKVASKTKQIYANEQEQALTDFLERKQIPNSEKSRQKLKTLLEERKAFDENFSLEDLSEKEINHLKNKENLATEKVVLNENINQAQTAETLIDTWKDEGFSNYQVLQKLLSAHETGEVTLLTKKYEQFKQFLTLLKTQEFGAKDTKKIIEIINRPGIDLSSPKAFEQMVFTIFEDEDISEVTKIKLAKQFKLIPIVNGDDLRSNLLSKQYQITEHENQRVEVEKTLVILEEQTKTTKSRLATLKEQILNETDYEKRLELEKQYDDLETFLERLEKDTETQELTKQQLEKEIPNTIVVRGAEAEIVDDEIMVSLPDSPTKVVVPLKLGNGAIGKAVNAYLVNETMKEVGLEDYFFYQSDFEGGNFPHTNTLDRSNSFLVKLGFSYDGLILKKSEQKRLSRLFKRLMKHNFYSSNRTQKENADMRLQELGLIQDRELNREKFTSKLIRLKQLGKIGI